MIVDENLNDCTSSYVNKLEEHCKQVSQICQIWSIVAILSIVGLIFTVYQKNSLVEDNKILKETLYKDETELALEHSIGYWFINQPEEVNDSILYDFLKDNNAWYPEILLKQAKIESGNYKSNIYVNSCNLYGMRKVGKRNTTQRGTYNGYGVYDNWCLSVLDRMLWDVFYFKNVKPTREEYLKAMSIYAEDSNYISKIK